VGEAVTGWTFLTNHAHVLLLISRDPEIRVRELAERVGITERAAHRIVADLVDAGYLSRARVGRRNRYQVHPERPLRHPIERDHEVGELLEVLGGPARRSRPAPARRAGADQESSVPHLFG
jgi:DNA-binding Lrp family transcriptional regulator